MTGPRLGITAMPEYIQSEGIDRILEQISDRAGATSVTTSPYVAAEAAPGHGHREPPDDGGAGRGRVLDRPLWGRREVWMETAPSFVPDASRYGSLAYAPPAPNALTETAGATIGAFLDAAGRRGLETWMQVQAAIPPGHRVQFGGPIPADEPLRPDGMSVPGRVDRNASLASEDLRAYMRAFVGDLCRTYPEVGGLKFDWPEYPVYSFDALFFDFNPAAERFARAVGTDVDRLRERVARFLAELEDGGVQRRGIALDDAEGFRTSLFDAYPALAELVELRSAIVADYARFLRDTVDEASGGRCRFFLQCFPPPLNLATGFDLGRAGACCDAVGVKLYTMHWPLIEAEYLAALRDRAGFEPRAVLSGLARILGLAPDGPRDPVDVVYPGPDAAHPCADADLTAKIEAARAALPSGTGLVALSHGYGPTADVIRRFRAAAAGPCDEIHVNRYCYLGDEKLDALRGAAVAPKA